MIRRDWGVIYNFYYFFIKFGYIGWIQLGFSLFIYIKSNYFYSSLNYFIKIVGI